MKKIFSFIAVLALALGATSEVQAQSSGLKFNLGAGLALPSTTFSGGGVSATVSATETPYVYAGVDYALPSNGQIHLEGGLQWMLLGNYKLFDNKSYISLPLSVRYQFSESLPLSLGAGVYAGKSFEEGMELDYGVLLKARYDFAQRFYATVQYNLGVKNHAGDSGTAKINALQLGVGITF